MIAGNRRRVSTPPGVGLATRAAKPRSGRHHKTPAAAIRKATAVLSDIVPYNRRVP